MTKKYISFFSGAMGLDIGLEKAGWDCLAVNEIDSKICKTINRNNKNNKKVYNCDIRDLSSEQLKRDLNLKKKELFAVVGGPPCQSFSTAGKRLGLQDERGNAFIHFLDISLKLNPKYIIIENVRGLLSSPMEHIPHNKRESTHGKNIKEIKGGALNEIITILENGGYTVNFNLYDMSYYGVPQKRERLIIFASKNGKKIPDIIPTHKDNIINFIGNNNVVTLKDSIKDLKSKEWVNFPPKRLKFFKMLKSGENWKNLPSEKVKKEAMGNSYFSGGGKTGFFRRLDWNKPSPTLLTSPIMMSTALCHPSEDRPLSIEEYKAIQTFPKDYVLEGSTMYKYKQIGNAIACDFGEAIGRHINDFDGNQLKESLFNLELSRYKNTSYDLWKKEYNSKLNKI